PKLLLVVACGIAAFAVLGLLVWAKRRQEQSSAGSRGSADGEWPFVLKPVMSAPEQVLYWRLVNALEDHIVLAQVQVSRVLGVAKGANVMSWNNRINRMSYDFVICTKDAQPICVIELDDASHNRQSRQEADAKKNRATAAAELRLVRW